MKPKVGQGSGMGALHAESGSPETPRSLLLKHGPHDSQPLTEPSFDPTPRRKPRPLALDSALTPGAIRPPAQVRLSYLHRDFRLATRGGRRRDRARRGGGPLDRCILAGTGLALPRDHWSCRRNGRSCSLGRHRCGGSDARIPRRAALLAPGQRRVAEASAA